MSPSKQKSTLDKKLKKVRKELSSVDSNLRSLSRTLEQPGESPAGGVIAPPDPPRILPRSRSQDHDTRFISYLASGGLESARPLRKEKHSQRNKAIVVSVFALMVLVWVVFRFLVRA